MADNSTSRDVTPPRQIRITDGHWQAYERVCKELGTTRSEDVVAHIRVQVQTHGDAEARRLLADGDAQAASRRARMHPGRPRKQRMRETSADQPDESDPQRTG